MTENHTYCITLNILEDSHKGRLWDNLAIVGRHDGDCIHLETSALTLTLKRTECNPDIVLAMFDSHDESSLKSALESVKELHPTKVVLASYYDYEYIKDNTNDYDEYVVRSKKGQVYPKQDDSVDFYELHMIEDAWKPLISILPISDDELSELVEAIETPYWG